MKILKMIDANQYFQSLAINHLPQDILVTMTVGARQQQDIPF
jgi:hypothetical protein